ncbi:hypothetical protein COAQ111491_04045 [Comamonas aquatilis]
MYRLRVLTPTMRTRCGFIAGIQTLQCGGTIGGAYLHETGCAIEKLGTSMTVHFQQHAGRIVRAYGEYVALDAVDSTQGHIFHPHSLLAETQIWLT